ncbi:MAG: cell division protein FtsQ/DivIB [Candidatus Omnitrophica bacterium]|nr:cell division protein FtsQ/DivIB [Candidatus Omnitrophota bacterium]MCG2706295.1 cell division protein FtsQ/DivIB [Candidatus Omnitrophota bacterium]
MKKPKIKLRLPRIKLRNFPVKPIIFIVVVVSGCLIIGYLGKALKKLDYFKIKGIIASQGQPDEFSYLKGQNIFDIDLNRESRYILKLYPTYKKIRLIRVLPNRLFIDFIKRKPLALVKLYRYFCVDQDQILFDPPPELETDVLPIILGLETKIFGPKVARKYDIKELTLALNIIKTINNNKSMQDYKLRTVDVRDPGSASFSLLEGLVVKIGEGELKNKINILNTLLGEARIKNGLGNIKYIDLRFKEAVIKFKDVR